MLSSKLEPFHFQQQQSADIFRMLSCD